MKEQIVPVGNVKLQVREHGRGEEAILFLHFSSANLMMWQRVVPYFEDTYRLVLVDLRGHGRSDKPENGYHMDVMAADTAGLMEALGLEQAHILGSSLGAEVGLSLTANYPDKVLSLVCDGASSSEFGPFSTWEGSQAEFEKMAAEEVENLRTTPPRTYPSVQALVDRCREVSQEDGSWNSTVEEMERYGARQLENGSYTKCLRGAALANYMGYYFSYRFEEYYRRVACPLLMITSQETWQNERERAALEGLAGLAPKAQIAVLPGWVHPYGWMLDPQPACQVVLKFLKNQG